MIFLNNPAELKPELFSKKITGRLSDVPRYRFKKVYNRKIMLINGNLGSLVLW